MGYFLEPNQLFHSIAERAKKEEFILDDLIQTLKVLNKARKMLNRQMTLLIYSKTSI